MRTVTHGGVKEASESGCEDGVGYDDDIEGAVAKKSGVCKRESKAAEAAPARKEVLSIERDTSIAVLDDYDDASSGPQIDEEKRYFHATADTIACYSVAGAVPKEMVVDMAGQVNDVATDTWNVEQTSCAWLQILPKAGPETKTLPTVCRVRLFHEWLLILESQILFGGRDTLLYEPLVHVRWYHLD